MNVKINIKRPQISKAEIAANKDFSEVLKMYKATAKPVLPFYRTTWFYAGLSAAAAVVVAMVIYIAPSHNTATLASLTTPMENVNVVPSQYALNAEQGGTITYKSGSVIKIPAKAFVDKAGKPVSGKVDISYRELKDPIDFFISGVPMNYDSAGVNYALESAGMVEIHATQKGEEVKLNPEKPVDIALASHQSGGQFNVYKLDADKKQWIYQRNGQENLTAANEEQADAPANSTTTATLQNAEEKLAHIQYEIAKSVALVKKLETSRPYEPREESKGHHRFSVGVTNLQEFPELAIYKDVMFQAGDDNKNFNDNSYNEEWDGAKLAKAGDRYILNLKKGEETVSYYVHPVFEGEGYNTAQKLYKTKLAEYEDMLVERKAAEGERQQELASLAEVVKETRDNELNRINPKQGDDATASTTPANPGNLTFHTITVNSFGIWGLNSLASLPQGATLTPHFVDEQGKEIAFENGKVYMIEKGRNVLFSFSDKSAISFNPEKQTMIWGLTADNKLAVFRYEDFKSLNKQSGECIFAMQISDKELTDETQIEYYLNI